MYYIMYSVLGYLVYKRFCTKTNIKTSSKICCHYLPQRKQLGKDLNIIDIPRKTYSGPEPNKVLARDLNPRILLLRTRTQQSSHLGPELERTPTRDPNSREPHSRHEKVALGTRTRKNFSLGSQTRQNSTRQSNTTTFPLSS